MRRQDALVTSFSAAIIVAAALYVLQPPAPIYYPLAHAWDWHKLAGVPSMAWYGRSAWALGAALASFGLAWPLTTRLAAPLWLPRALSLLALFALLSALGTVAWHEYSQLHERTTASEE